MDSFLVDSDDIQSSENENKIKSHSDDDDDSDPNFNPDKHAHDDEDDDEDECHSFSQPEKRAKHKGKAKISEQTEPLAAAAEAEEIESAESQNEEKETEVRNVKDKSASKKKKQQKRAPRSRAGTVQQPVDESEAKIISKEIAAQCRSYFYGVRRKYNHKTGKFSPFFAEMRKPDEVKLVSDHPTVNINIKGFQTDVQAAVACSVLIHIFKTFVDATRKPDKAPFRPGENDPRVVVLKCHSVLVQRRLEKMKQKKGYARFPDCTLHHKIQKFCRKCADDFLQIAEDVKNGVLEMPEELGLRDALTRFFNDAHLASLPYPSDKIPAEKQSMPCVVKRKFDNLEDIVGVKEFDRGGFIELECSCDDHPQPARLRWELKQHDNLCLCHGIRYNLHLVP